MQVAAFPTSSALPFLHLPITWSGLFVTFDKLQYSWARLSIVCNRLAALPQFAMFLLSSTHHVSVLAYHLGVAVHQLRQVAALSGQAGNVLLQAAPILRSPADHFCALASHLGKAVCLLRNVGVILGQAVQVIVFLGSSSLNLSALADHLGASLGRLAYSSARLPISA